MAIDLERDARELAPQVSDKALATVSELATKMLRLEAEAADFDEKAKAKREEAMAIATKALPDAMEAAKTKGFTLADGRELAIKDIFAAGITEENKPECLSWLRSVKLGDIIKDTINVPLEKGSKKQLKEIIKLLKKLKVPFEQKETVHNGTLTKVLRERAEASKPIPRALFNVFEGVKAVVKADKKTVTHQTQATKAKDKRVAASTSAKQNATTSNRRK